MSNQFIYGQPIYGQTNIQYQTGIETVPGAEFGTYESTSYQQSSTNNVKTIPEMTYQTQFEQQPIYLGKNQEYTQQINYSQTGQSGQVYQYEQPGVDITGLYQQQIQQPKQNYIINQHQQAKMIPQQTKMSQQQTKIVQQKQSMQQPTSFSRNPYYNQQFQGQNIPQQLGQNAQYQGAEFDKPIIESEFQPDFQLANSVIGQSQIKYEPKQSQIKPNQSKVMPITQQSQQQNYPQGYIPRNPNLNIQQYAQYSQDSHFVTAKDPGSRTVGINNFNNITPNISNKVTSSVPQVSQLPPKESSISHNSLEDNQEPEVGVGISNFNQSIGSSNIQNIGNSNLQNIESNMNDNVLANKMTNDQFEKENPIDEKRPDVSNMDNFESQNNEVFPQEMDQNPLKESVTDNLDHLPTIGSIMKGTNELLPPPTKKKYQ